ncbi:hypothetical protein ACYSTU_11850 [Pseudomonas glycinis]
MSDIAKYFISNLTIAALKGVDGKERPLYEQALRNACSSVPPPYGMKWFGEEFRIKGRDASWFGGLLISDAHMEGYSAGRLWQYGERISDKALSEGMLRHARDEAKHSKLFGKILVEVFPQVQSAELSEKLRSFVPLFPVPNGALIEPPGFEELLNSLILINLYEIKALVLGRLLSPLALAHAPEMNRLKISKMLGCILNDEAHHVKYSADFIEAACAAGYHDYVCSAFEEFQKTLNIITESELLAASEFNEIDA